nr:PIR protein, putative [Plasmodium sp. DRC-Itaito]
MKVHYINILLFAHALNILVNTHKKPYITPKIPTTRLLCECELYTPANYDNDPEMKSVMDNFNKQTQQRFHEYDERMKKSSNYDNDTEMKSVKENFDRRTSQRLRKYNERMQDKRQKRKEQRDKNIQKIIEEDKREKSLAEKVEKGCLRCGCALGGVAASVGVFGGLGVYGSEMAAATVAAKACGY